MKLRRDPFQAIADPTRRSILVLLATQSMSAGEIAGCFDTARPTISKHLNILTECELLQSRKQGREIHYELQVQKMKEIDNWLEQFRNIWESKFDQLEDVIRKIKSK